MGKSLADLAASMGINQNAVSSAAPQPKLDMNNLGQGSFTTGSNWGNQQQSLQAAANSQGVNSDETAYQLAYALAVNDDRATNDRELKGLTDYYFDQIGHSDDVTGEDFRPDYTNGALYNTLGFLSEGINGTNNAIGNGLDWIVDNPIAGAAGYVTGDEQMAQNMRDAFNGRDLAWIPSVAEDVALASIPGAGIPLVAAKNLIEDYDDIYEAAYGKDSVSGADLSGKQRGAKGAGVAADVALSAIPGGKVGAKATEKALLGAMKRGEGNAAKASEKLLDDAVLADTEANKLLEQALGVENLGKEVSRAQAKEAAGTGKGLGQLIPESADDVAAREAGVLKSQVTDYNTNRTVDELMERAAKQEARSKSLLDQAEKGKGSDFEQALSNIGGGLTKDQAIRIAEDATAINPIRRIRASQELAPYYLDRMPEMARGVRGNLGKNSQRQQLKNAIEGTGSKKAGAEAAKETEEKSVEEILDKGAFGKTLDRFKGKGKGKTEKPDIPVKWYNQALGQGVSIADMGIQSSANTDQDLPEAFGDAYRRIQAGDWSAALPIALAMAPGPRRKIARKLGGNAPYYALKGDIMSEGISNYYDPGSLTPEQQMVLDTLMTEGYK